MFEVPRSARVSRPRRNTRPKVSSSSLLHHHHTTSHNFTQHHIILHHSRIQVGLPTPPKDTTEGLLFTPHSEFRIPHSVRFFRPTAWECSARGNAPGGHANTLQAEGLRQELSHIAGLQPACSNAHQPRASSLRSSPWAAQSQAVGLSGIRTRRSGDLRSDVSSGSGDQETYDERGISEFGLKNSSG